MSKNSLVIVSAKDCPACINYKKMNHDKVVAAFNSKNYPITLIEVNSKSEDLKKYNIPESIKKCVRWFPFFAFARNNELISVFNGDKNGTCYDHKTVGSRQPNADNLIEFYESNLSNNLQFNNVPVSAALGSTAPSTLGLPAYVPTTPCSRKFTGRLY